MIFTETELDLKRAPITKVLLTIDEYNELVIEKHPYDCNNFKIFNYDSLTKTTSQLADFINGKYEIYNQNLFNEYYLKPMKRNKKLVKDLQSFIRQDHTMNGFKHINIKFSCFKRRVNINVTKFLRKTKKNIWS
jgi:hypothetical protein